MYGLPTRFAAPARPKNDKAFKSDGGNASRKQSVKAPVIYTETVLLERKLVGLAFGKDAANLEKARGLDGVITIDFDRCLSTFRIEAKTHQAAISARKLLEYAEEIFQVPSNIVGLIIGKKGRNILDIKTKSGIERIVEVKEKRFQREKGKIPFKIVGTKTSISEAKVLLESSVEKSMAIKKQGLSKADSTQEVSDDDFASADEDESDEDDNTSEDSTRGKLTDVLESVDKLKADFKAQKGDMLRLQGEVDGLKKKLKKERKQRAVLEKSLGEVTTKLKDQQKTHELALHVVAKNMTRVHNFMKKNIKSQPRSAPTVPPRVVPPAPPRVVPAVPARESPAVPTRLALTDLTRVASDVLAKVTSVRAAPKVPDQNTATNLTRENLDTSGVFPDSASASQLTPKSLFAKQKFMAKEKSQLEVEIWNSACLPVGLIVLTDNANRILKVYTFKGSLCHTRKSTVFSALAVLSATEVAATSDGCIEILRITESKLSVKESFKIPKAYHALAAVSSNHLAGAYGLMLFDSGIDLFNMNGKLIRNICTGVKADCLSLTPKGELVGIHLNRIFLMDLMSEQNVGCKRQVGIPGTNLASLSVDRYGYLFIINRESQTVLRVDSSLQHSSKLWTLAEPLVGAGDLCTITVARESCVCVTKKGLVSVCQIVY